jgi:redox-sensitive bicupin YhaK (pirin superfamily)
VQLSVALPDAARDAAPAFEHHVPPVVSPAAGVRAAVFVGSLFGSHSPVATATPLLGAECSIPAPR